MPTTVVVAGVTVDSAPVGAGCAVVGDEVVVVGGVVEGVVVPVAFIVELLVEEGVVLDVVTEGGTAAEGLATVEGVETGDGDVIVGGVVLSNRCECGRPCCNSHVRTVSRRSVNYYRSRSCHTFFINWIETFSPFTSSYETSTVAGIQDILINTLLGSLKANSSIPEGLISTAGYSIRSVSNASISIEIIAIAAFDVV